VIILVANNPATIKWTVTDSTGAGVVGAQVKGTLYQGRDVFDPGNTPGSIISTMQNLVFADNGDGTYSVSLPSSSIPPCGENFTFVIDAILAATNIGHWDEPTQVLPSAQSYPYLTTVSDLKGWFQIDDSDTSMNSDLRRQIAATSTDFLLRIRRPGLVPAANYSELIELQNWVSASQFLDVFPKNYPINSVASVTLNETDVPLYDPATPEKLGWLFDATAFPEDRHKITLRGLFWPMTDVWMQPIRINVQYNGGYSVVPPDIAQAISEWCGYKKGLAQLQGQNQTAQSIYIGQYRQDMMVANSTFKAQTIDIPESVCKVIDLYTRPLPY
jgi:hypothetical protein